MSSRWFNNAPAPRRESTSWPRAEGFTAVQRALGPLPAPRRSGSLAAALNRGGSLANALESMPTNMKNKLEESIVKSLIKKGNLRNIQQFLNTTPIKNSHRKTLLQFVYNKGNSETLKMMLENARVANFDKNVIRNILKVRKTIKTHNTRLAESLIAKYSRPNNYNNAILRTLLRNEAVPPNHKNIIRHVLSTRAPSVRGNR
jgi:hypothetical protein